MVQDLSRSSKLLPLGPGEGLDHVNGNGWSLAVTGNLNPRFGLTFDGAGYYKSVEVLTSSGPVDVDVDLYTFMVGPQVKLFKKGPLSSFLCIVFGGANGGGELQNGLFVVTGPRGRGTWGLGERRWCAHGRNPRGCRCHEVHAQGCGGLQRASHSTGSPDDNA